MNTHTMNSRLTLTNPATRAFPPRIAQKIRKISVLRQTPIIAAGTLNGSVEQVTRFLRELIELTGQEAQSVPVLQLQLGEILTHTTVQMTDRNYLLITALMPKCFRSHHLSQANEATSLQAAQDIAYLWHADEGRHIGVRKIPITDLADERSVMDAILTTVDQAARFSSARGSKPAM